MSKKMLVNATQPEENRVAIVEDGILTELDIEVVGREQTRGNIYKATVVRVESGLQAAFVDYGGLRLGFLQMGEIHPDLFSAADPKEERKGRQRINDVLRRGQEILVQVVKGERGNKGAALTTFLSLAGRYMVLMPESDSTGVSRKIEEDSVRKKLKATMKSLELRENMGYIVRTAGVDQSKEELKRDFDYLVRVYENILALAKKAKAPALIYKESNLVIRSIRDYFSPDIDEVLVDDPKVAQEAKDFLQQVMPECVKLVKLHQEKRPIFSRYQIEEQIEIISRNKVLLPSGGSIVIDRTEALVAIDVNSGKMAGEQGVEATAYKTNLEAATEVGRQLRLRDLGGLIVIDFIDMRERKNGRDVEKALKESMKSDKAKVSFGKISSFGLLEMSRQRIKDALAEGTFLICPHCEGSGRLKSPEAQAVAALRKIQGGLAKGHIARIEVDIPLDAANYLLNAMRDELFELEQHNLVEIMVRGRADMIASQIEIVCIRREKEDELYLQPVTAGNDEPIEAPEATAPALRTSPPLAPAADVPALIEGEKKKRGRRKKSEMTAVTEIVREEPPAVVTSDEPIVAAAPSAEERRLFGSLIDESDEEDGSEGAPGEAGGEGKKKRKRRRKKKKAVAVEAVEDEASAGEGEDENEDDEGAAASENEGTATPLAADGEGELRKKKRRRKRKKKGSSAAEIAPSLAPPATDEEGEEESSDLSGADAEPESSGDGEVRRKRKRRRKKRSSAVSSEGEVVVENDASIPAPPATVTVEVLPPPVLAAVDDAVVAAKSRPARRGRQVKAPVAIAPELPPTLTVEASPLAKVKAKRAPAKKTTSPPLPIVAAEIPEKAPAKAKVPRPRKTKVAEPVIETPPLDPLPAVVKKPRAPRKKSSDQL